MKPIAISPTRPPAPESPPVVHDRTKAVRHVRQLIGLYLLLLIFEGALRKWILPQLSAPLLLVRDPVVVVIYLVAIRARVFPQNVWIVIVEILAALFWATGIIVMLPYFPLKTVLLVTGFGVRSNFLHLPLIFIIPKVFDLEDVKRIGWWTMVGMIPMAVLMALQFAASPDSFINLAAGGEGTQMHAGGGRVRPAGLFSFVSGTIYYASATAAFLLHAAMAKLRYRPWLLYGSAAALILALGVSGSRATVLGVVVVVASLGALLLIRPTLLNRFVRQLIVGVVLLWAVSHLPLFRQGIDILTNRFTESAEEVSVVDGLLLRMLDSFTEAFRVFGQVPLGGHGLGVGTMGGAALLTGQATFLLAENEWTRVLLESGPLLGLAFIAWRIALAVKLGWFSFQQVRAGNTLPLFLFAAGVFLVLQGTFGQPTSLGFTVALAGLCLAARSPETAATEKDGGDEPSASPPPALRRRSPYADRLHRPGPRSRLHHGPSGR
jgi:hypothetical protein